MILSRMKPTGAANLGDLGLKTGRTGLAQETPTVSKFVENRDFLGAMTLLEYEKFNGSSSGSSNQTDLWMAYCAFHSGDYKRALSIYQSLKMDVYAACCYFFLGMYQEAKQVLQKSRHSALKVRLLFHLAHKDSDEDGVMEHHKQLRDLPEDQLSLAAVHYLRAHYQEAIDIYKRLLIDNKDLMALHVYIALCYYKLDYYDVSQEVLSVYLQKVPDSLIAINLKACNIYRLFNGRSAEMEIRSLVDSPTSCPFGKDLLDHNMVIFRNGEGALQVLPALSDVIPEARLNLVIHHLRQDEAAEAYNLMQGVEPTLPSEYILKGIVHAVLAQETNNKDYLDVAIQYLHLVGASSSECDTIPGRQCMASALFLQRQYEDVLLYFNSIKPYLGSDETFKFNYAQVKTYLGHYKDAEEELLSIQNPKYRADYTYMSCLARCLVMNRKASQAWDTYTRMETSAESLGILHLVANDSYRTGQFFVAVKAFDVLDKYDPSPEHADAKRGACVGLFQMILAGREHKESLSEIIPLMRNPGVNDSQSDQILRVIFNWAKENRVKL